MGGLNIRNLFSYSFWRLEGQDLGSIPFCFWWWLSSSLVGGHLLAVSPHGLCSVHVLLWYLFMCPSCPSSKNTNHWMRAHLKGPRLTPSPLSWQYLQIRSHSWLDKSLPRLGKVRSSLVPPRPTRAPSLEGVWKQLLCSPSFLEILQPVLLLWVPASSGVKWG